MKTIEARTNNKFTSVLFDRNGSSIVETLIVIIVISVLVVVVMAKYDDIEWEAKKAALKTELSTLRQSILFFKMTKGKYPESLKELITQNVVLPYKDTIISSKYLEHYALDKDKNILDPFDKPYAYNNVDGSVRSTKEGFENW